MADQHWVACKFNTNIDRYELINDSIMSQLSAVSSVESQLFRVQYDIPMLVKESSHSVKCPKKKGNGLKIFQLIQKNLWIFGSPENPFEKRNLLTLFKFSLGASSACMYFVCNAETFLEYANSLYMIIAHTSGAAIYGIILWRLQKILHYFIKAQRVIDGSEFWFRFIPVESELCINFHSRARKSSIESHLCRIESFC